MPAPAQRVEQAPVPDLAKQPTGARFALGAVLLGFFVITLDALIVSVALPSIGQDLGAGSRVCSG